MSDEQGPGTDLVRQAATEAAPEVGRFIGTIFGSASMQLDAMFGDRVGWWRMRQAVKLASRAQKLLDEAGIEAHQLPFRTSVPLLEAGSLEDDPQLCERWAALLANAAAAPSDVPASFPAILRELEPASAAMLEEFFTDALEIAPEIRPFFGFRPLESTEDRGLTVEQIKFHVDNLVRLGLIRSGPIVDSADDVYDSVAVTSLGVRFMRACRPPGAPEPDIRWADREALRAEIRAREDAGQAPARQVVPEATPDVP